MKQLTVYCSRDLEERVVAALDRAGAEGFFRVGGSSGSKFLPAGELPRTTSWDAVALTVPAIPPDAAQKVVAELEAYANACEIQPCLRIVMTAIEQVW
jgi:hypothetical protein